MSHTVRSHTRKTASGRTVTVRQHSRTGGSAASGKRPSSGGLFSRLFRSRIRRQRRQAAQAEGWWAEEQPAKRTKDEKRAAKAEARAAQQALEDYTSRKHAEWKAAGNKGGMPEDDTYLDLNDAAWVAHEKWKGRPEKWRRSDV